MPYLPTDTERRRRNRRAAWLFLGAILILAVVYPMRTSAETPAPEGPGTKAAAEAITGHGDPLAPIILGLTWVLGTALVGRFLARKLRQPPVLGELIGGLILGNIAYYYGMPLIAVLREGESVFNVVRHVLRDGMSLSAAAAMVFSPESLQPGGPGERVVSILSGSDGFAVMSIAHVVDVFSRAGVIFLLFIVGLESDLKEMRRVGAISFWVATIGVVSPMLLGYGVTWWLMPDQAPSSHLFVGATLAATSVGITARVFRDMGMLHTREAKIVLGAAVIDDVMGLILLAVISGIVVTGTISLSSIAAITGKAVLFLVLAIALGRPILPLLVRLFTFLDENEAKLFLSLFFAFAMAWLANFVGLAPIVGAFAAGLLVEEGHFVRIEKQKRSLIDLIGPLESILVPIFFVVMGIQVKLETFVRPELYLMSGALIAAAILGKIICGFPAGKTANRMAIGIGMVPRGEVGLIFVSIGKGLGVISDSLFSAVVTMVIVTTLIAPPLLKVSLSRRPSNDNPDRG